MTTETPNERRTRLIEQYVIEYLRKNTPYTSQDAMVLVAEALADAVIAATPQEREACHDSEVEELQEHVNDLEILLTDARANLEIERQRKKQPSEAETRLIEMLEETITILGWRSPSLRFDLRDRLAAIKHDLGVK